MFFSAESLNNITQIDRDSVLLMSNADLLDCCSMDVFVGKGPGGQHRNRNYTAVRLVFRYDKNFTVEESSSRSQKQNIELALNKLRTELAMFWRKKPAENSVYTHLNSGNQLYAFELAKFLDVLADSEFEHKIAAQKLGVSNTILLKELARDYRIWEIFQQSRKFLNKSELKKPGN